MAKHAILKKNAHTEKVLNWNFASRLGKTNKFTPWAPRFFDSNVVEKMLPPKVQKTGLLKNIGIY